MQRMYTAIFAKQTKFKQVVGQEQIMTNNVFISHDTDQSSLAMIQIKPVPI